MPWEIADKTLPMGAKRQIMPRQFFLRPAAVLGAVATLSLLATGPARAQLRGPVATPAAQPPPSSATPAGPRSIVGVRRSRHPAGCLLSEPPPRRTRPPLPRAQVHRLEPRRERRGRR